jgi:hypothetical protein
LTPTFFFHASLEAFSQATVSALISLVFIDNTATAKSVKKS